MSAVNYNVGNHVCLVKGREGIIKFKGEIEGKRGSFYGIQVTKGTGKHSGLYKNVKYFECTEGQGIFVEDKHILSKIETYIYSDDDDDEIPISKKKKKKKTKKYKKQIKKKAKKQKSEYITQLEYIESDEELDMLQTDIALELLNLSKTELIKRCKDKGIVCLGKKQELVLKLLTTKTKKYVFEKQQSVTLDSKNKNDYLTLYECNYYFINGFIKETINIKFNNKIKILLLAYIDTIIPKFNLCPRIYMNEIKDNGAIIKRNKKNKSKKQYLFGCSNGYKPNSGIYRFSIRINKLQKPSKNIKEKDEIGLICDKKFITMNNAFDDIALWDVDCNSYYVSLNQTHGAHKISSGGFNDDRIGLLSKDSIPIKKGDIITIVLNTNNSRMRFEKNGRKYCEWFDIISDCIYYPCVSCSSRVNEYEIVWF